MNYLYAMYAGNYIKIGITASLETRIKAVQTGCPLSIHKVRFIKTDTRMNSLRLEQELHRILNKENTNGEWFNKSSSDNIRFCEIFKNSENKEICIAQNDISFDSLETLYSTYFIEDRDKKIEALIKLQNHLRTSYDYHFVYKSKSYILNKVDKEIFKNIKYSSKKNNSNSDYKKNKKMEKLKKNYPWLFQDEVTQHEHR